MSAQSWPFASSSVAQFRDAYRLEHARTRKVLHALPEEHSEFRPHERSNHARQLGWTFVLEEAMILKALRNQQVLGSGFPPAPDSWSTILEMFDAQHEDIARELQVLKGTPANTVKFFTGPKQTADYPAMDFLWFMLFDQIHHRGQLSVYVRMTGGKVPAIYGPSADEPWF